MGVTNRCCFWALVFAVLCSLTWSGLAMAQHVERISLEDLRSRLGQEDLVLLDVRTRRDWKTSDVKIKGALRPTGDIVQWAEDYPRDTPLVLYCD